MTNIARPEIELDDLMRTVSGFVRDKTEGRQTVWIDGSLDRAFYLGKYAAGGLGRRLTPPEPQAGRRAGVPAFRQVLLSDADLAGKDAANSGWRATRSSRGAASIFTDQALTAHFAEIRLVQAADQRAEARADRAAECRAHPAVRDAGRGAERRLHLRRFRPPAADARRGGTASTSSSCAIARNEIYARRGRKFVIREVREYFQQFDWYDPRFGEVELTYVEQKNVDLIRGFEK